jgi:hypothetical protein
VEESYQFKTIIISKQDLKFIMGELLLLCVKWSLKITVTIIP